MKFLTVLTVMSTVIFITVLGIEKPIAAGIMICLLLHLIFSQVWDDRNL